MILKTHKQKKRTPLKNHFRKFCSILATFWILLHASTVWAQDFNQCKALRSAEAYAKYENYQYIFPGQDGWFFRTKQDLWTKYSVKKNIPLFQDFVRVLKGRGTDLVIAYMPTRGVAVRNKLPVGNDLMKDFDPQAVQRDYEGVIRTLNTSGIRTVGLSDFTHGDTYFYKADHHWSRAGADAMAKALTEAIKNLDSYKALPKTKYELLPDDKPAEVDGSFNAVLNAICLMKAPTQEDHMVHTQGGAVDEDTLFGNGALPAVALVGTSNSKKQNNDVHFDDLLRAYLSTDIYNAAISGGGLDDSILVYLSSDDFQKNPAKILIWEIPGYYDLDGGDMRNLLAQASAAVRGPCNAQAQVSNVSQKLQTQNVSLFTGLETKSLQDPYVYMRFDKPFRKKFSIETHYNNGEKATFRFNRSKFYPADGAFYYKLPRRDEPISSVSLKVPSNMQDMSVKAQLCATPMPLKARKTEHWWQRFIN
jgi:alginate biosynthesis protein AlgX